MNSQSAVRRYPHSFSIEQILAKPEMRSSDSSYPESAQDESGRGGLCGGVSRVSSPATSSCLEDNLDDGKSNKTTAKKMSCRCGHKNEKRGIGIPPSTI